MANITNATIKGKIAEYRLELRNVKTDWQKNIQIVKADYRTRRNETYASEDLDNDLESMAFAARQQIADLTSRIAALQELLD